MWVETAYLTIMRQSQMEELRMIPEGEWPDKSYLESYQPHYPDDIDFYHPDDLLVPLGMWLRDHRIRERKERERQRKDSEGRNIVNSM